MRSDRDHLLAAARLALRGHGRAEPNPLVGCLIVAADGRILGWGYHERCGGPHAEIHALQRAGEAARGATAYITLEPCNHTGRTGPCTKALIEAGVARVIVAREDPNPVAAGGFDALGAAGIEVIVTGVCAEAMAISDPFVHRVRTGRPWVVAKWAQTLDGRIATRSPHCQSKWISSEASRRMVHRERGRVDVILTGIGTVLRDDPLLTARGVRIRRVARRVIIDPQLQIPLDSAIVQSARQAPATVVFDRTERDASGAAAQALENAGIDLMPMERDEHGLSLEPILHDLASRFDATNVLVEAGTGLLTRLFRENLVNEAWVFVGGLLLGDEHALPPVRGFVREAVTDAAPLDLTSVHRRAGDVVLRYRVRAI